MNLEATVDSTAKIENAGGQYYLTLPYTSSIGKTTERLSIQVPIKSERPSANDKKALVEAATVQGGLGKWIQQDDGSVWLVPTKPG